MVVKTGAKAIENASRVDTTLLDKTGTLTTGAMKVNRKSLRGDWPEKTSWNLVHAAEAHQEHWVHYSVSKYMSSKYDLVSTKATIASYMEAIPGSGVSCIIDGVHIVIGSLSHLDSHGIARTEISMKTSIPYFRRSPVCLLLSIRSM